MNKSFAIHDKWTDLDKVNNVEINSIDGVIESVKINGEEARGGGSSDFSTAKVTMINNTNYMVTVQGIFLDVARDRLLPEVLLPQPNAPMPKPNVEMVLYKGTSSVPVTVLVNSDDDVTLNVDGSYIEDEGDYYITGDCTITIS